MGSRDARLKGLPPPAPDPWASALIASGQWFNGGVRGFQKQHVCKRIPQELCIQGPTCRHSFCFRNRSSLTGKTFTSCGRRPVILMPLSEPTRRKLQKDQKAAPRLQKTAHAAHTHTHLLRTAFRIVEVECILRAKQ